MGPPQVTDLKTIRIEDYLHVKGVRLVEPGTPQWKIKPLQEKNLQLINQYLKTEEEKAAEEARWAAIPEWKRKIMQEKEKKKKEEEEEQRQKDDAERKEREKFESLPEWKQQIIKQKRNSVQDSNSNSDTKSEASNGYPESQEDSTLIQKSCEDEVLTEAANEETPAGVADEEMLAEASEDELTDSQQELIDSNEL